jgi:hypothetical protein
LWRLHFFDDRSGSHVHGDVTHLPVRTDRGTILRPANSASNAVASEKNQRKKPAAIRGRLAA